MWKTCSPYVVALMGCLALIAACAPEGQDNAAGERLYAQHCRVCHQANGSGVPMMQPALRNAGRVTGPKGDLIAFVLEGSAGLAPAERQYDNDMPGFAHLDDAELAAVLTYIRQNFDNAASAVTPEDVAAVRNRPG